MAKIIKVGSQNPTFTSQKIKKSSPLHTHRNSNEATNPFKFTNFEGNTLQFADVFEGFKPQSTSKLRMVASSVAGSMNKIKSSIPESIINFVNKVRSRVSTVLGQANEVWTYAKNTDILDVPGISHARDFIMAERHLPEIYNLSSHITAMKESMAHRMERMAEMRRGLSEKCNNLVSSISFHGRNKYANMSVAELETHFAAALAEGGNA